MSLNQSMFGLLMQTAASGGGDVVVKSGTVTLASTATSIVVDPGRTGKPVYACILRDAAIYGQDGVNGAFYARMPEATINRFSGYDYTTAEYLTVLETRTSYTYIAPQLLRGDTRVGADGKITFGVRHSNFPYFAGTYSWFAFYYDYPEGD